MSSESFVFLLDKESGASKELARLSCQFRFHHVWRAHAPTAPWNHLKPAGTEVPEGHCDGIDPNFSQEAFMGRGILLWLLGIPIPIIILIMLFVR